MTKKLLLLALATTIALGVFTSSHVSAATINVASGESIQEAINEASAGDVITVAAGTFAGPITIDKPLTLRGAQAGVDARERSGAETIITSQYAGGFSVQSTGVTIDGFTIDGEAASVYGRAISLPGGVDVSNLTIENNVITNNQTGVVTAAAGTNVTNLLITRNNFIDNNTQGIAAGVFIANAVGTGIEVIDNSFANTDDGSAGSTNAVSLSGTPEALLENLTISGNTSRNDGSFAYVYNASDVLIEDNTSDDQVGNGVLIGDNTTDVLVRGNTLTNSNNGVRIGGAGSSNIAIIDNIISGMATAGVLVADSAVEDTVVVAGNSITDNATGILNQSDVAVDANLNWWGCEAGPGSDGCDTIDGVVLASEWFTDPAMTTSNLDAEDPATVPGVPNTGQVGALSGSVVAIAATVVVAILATITYRRRSSNQ